MDGKEQQAPAALEGGGANFIADGLGSEADYVERLIGPIRRECLGHQIILDAAHLRRVMKAYADYYNKDRTHLGIGKDSPNGRGVEVAGEIISTPVLGGLHRRYRRDAVE